MRGKRWLVGLSLGVVLSLVGETDPAALADAGSAPGGDDIAVRIR